VVAESSARAAERAGDHEQVAGLCPSSAGNALCATDRSHAEIDAVRGGCVTAEHRDAGLRDPSVELDHIVELGLSWQPDADDQTFRLGAARSKVAEVDGGGAEAELAPGDPVEAKVDGLDERVLRNDPAISELRCVVLDSLRQPAALELGEQAKLPQLREPH
jgi:hypothetical protein